MDPQKLYYIRAQRSGGHTINFLCSSFADVEARLSNLGVEYKRINSRLFAVVESDHLIGEVRLLTVNSSRPNH